MRAPLLRSYYALAVMSTKIASMEKDSGYTTPLVKQAALQASPSSVVLAAPRSAWGRLCGLLFLVLIAVILILWAS